MINRRQALRATAGMASGLIVGGAAAPNMLPPAAAAQSLELDQEFPWRTISELAPRIRARGITSVEVTEFMLDRIERLDAKFNSYITVTETHALEAAQRADHEIESGNYRGPLHGVPIAVKDLCDTRGIRTTAGLSFLMENVPDRDATVVKRLKSAGAIILGKLNMTEGAMAGYHRDFRVPKNPWDSSVWTGASSSGSGVATAAGLAFATLGSDTGGSIRYPSASCGIVGLKPTWGRVSRAGIFPLAPSMDHIGPMARSTADCAIMLDAIAGHDNLDPTSLIDQVPAFAGEIGKPIRGTVIGWDERYATDGVDAELSDALRHAIDVLENLGARITRIRLPDLLELSKGWIKLGAAEALHAHAEFYPDGRKKYGRFFRTFLDMGTKVTGSEYAEAHQSRLQCCGELRKAFSSIDLLACPTMGGPPMKMTQGHQYDAKVDQYFSKDMDWGKFTVPFDFSGQPTLSTPCGISSYGLPLSLQLVGKHLQEGLLCRVGDAFEQATGFNQLHPETGT